METQNKEGKRVSESPFFKNMLHKAEDYLKKPLRVNQVLNEAYHKATEKKEIGTIAGEVWEGLQVLFRMIRATVAGEYHGIPTRNVVGGLAVVLYFLSPIDFIPDFVPVLGLLDDVALAAWFMTSIKHEMDRFVEWEQGNQATAGAGGGGGRTGGSGNRENTDKSFVDPKYEGTERSGMHSAGKGTPPNPKQQVVPEDEAMANKAKAVKTSIKEGGIDDTYQDSQHRHAEPKHEHNVRSTQADKNATERGAAHDTEEPPTGAAPNGAGEPDLRSNTTDSTRQSSRGHDDATAGGNVR